MKGLRRARPASPLEWGVSSSKQDRAGEATAARLRRYGPELALLAAFALSRLVARMEFGLRFDSTILGYWQVLDLPLLRGDLLRSLFYLHSQPPLPNLALGIVLKWAPEALAPAVFEAAFLVLGYLGIVGMYALVVELGAPRGAALAAALVQTLSTTWLVYESWLFYTLPTAVLITWAAVWLARAARGHAGAAAAFAAAVAALSWIRATYQPAWVVAALALLLFAVRSCAPGVRACAGAPPSPPSCWPSPSPRRTTSSWAPSRAARGSA